MRGEVIVGDAALLMGEVEIGEAVIIVVRIGNAGVFASSASSRSWGVDVARLSVGRGFLLGLPSPSDGREASGVART